MSARDNLIAAGYNDPILYLPLDDFEAPGVNLGTGGDFTLNGVVAQSGRGPNQWNCVASEFDGVGDYLRKNPLGGTDSKHFTLSISTKYLTGNLAFHFYYGGGESGSLIMGGNYAYHLRLANSSGDVIMRLYVNHGALGERIINHLTVSVDLSDTTRRSVFLNGENVSEETGGAGTNWGLYTDAVIGFSTPDVTISGVAVSSSYDNLILGEMWLDNTYIDLSTNNPFWDEDTQKPKPVLQVLEETGNTPLIAMPIRADDAGKNYGTGGDFTVNSGPFIGARGASEFWARSAEFYVGTSAPDKTNYLSTSSFVMPSSYTSFSFVFDYKTTNDFVYSTWVLSVDTPSYIGINVGFRSNDESLVIYLNGYSYPILPNIVLNKANVWQTFFISYNGESDTLYVNVNGSSSSQQVNTTITLSGSTNALIGNFFQAGQRDLEGNSSTYYFTTDYIDFSQESERLKFVDAFGYPVDIRPAIKAGDIPDPLIYMPFDDPNDLGKNLGTGGDFTVNGTVTPGSDVSP